MNHYKDYIEKQKKVHKGSHLRNHKIGRGPSSFRLHDQELVFKEFDISKGDNFLDLGCGAGEYSLYAAKYTGSQGTVYAIDVMNEVIMDLEENAEALRLSNLKAIAADITKPLSLESNSIDICLVSTVLHTIDLNFKGDSFFKEIFRVLKPEGRLITIDCKKENNGFGPPIHLRISPEELEDLVLNKGFDKFKLTDLGHFYMYQFKVKK